MPRFPGGGPGIGKEASKPKGRVAAAKQASKPRGTRTARTSGAKPTGGGSNTSRRIITDTYSSQVTLSDFVVAGAFAEQNVYFFIVSNCL